MGPSRDCYNQREAAACFVELVRRYRLGTPGQKAELVKTWLALEEANPILGQGLALDPDVVGAPPRWRRCSARSPGRCTVGSW